MSLFCFSLLYVQQTVGFLYFDITGIGNEWAAYRGYNRLAEFGLGSILTFFALALWIENQRCRIVEIAATPGVREILEIGSSSGVGST